MKRKYSVMFDLGTESNFKGVKETGETANEINEISCGIAPNTYMALCIAAEKFMFEYDEDTDAGRFFDIGINALNELGYIEIGGELENDDYKMIWIVK